MKSLIIIFILLFFMGCQQWPVPNVPAPPGDSVEEEDQQEYRRRRRSGGGSGGGGSGSGGGGTTTDPDPDPEPEGPLPGGPVPPDPYDPDTDHPNVEVGDCSGSLAVIQSQISRYVQLGQYDKASALSRKCLMRANFP